MEPDLTDLTLASPVVGTNDNPNTASIAWQYKPDATSSNNTEGNLSFTIEIKDDLGGTTSQVVNLIRYPINEVATATGGQTAEVTAVGEQVIKDKLILNDADDDNQALNVYALVSSESNNKKTPH